MRLLFFLIFLFPFSLSAQYDLESNLTDEEKLYGLSKFWSEAQFNFAYFDQTSVNWDSAYQAFIPRVIATPNTFEYYREMKRFCALLEDGHTDVYSPNSLYKEGTFIRLILTRIDDQVVVENVAEVVEDKVPIGSVLLSVDGQPTDEFFGEHIMPLMSASTEIERWNDALRRYSYPLRDTIQTQKMEFLTPSGEKVIYENRYHNQNTTFARNNGEWTRFDWEMMEGDIAHVKINTFGDGGVVDDFEAIVPELKSAKAVILDLRQNGGGSSNTGAAILQYFTDQDLVGSVWKTREYRPAYRAWGDWLVTETFDDLEEWPEDEQEWYHTSVANATGNSWYLGDTMSHRNIFETTQLSMPLVVLISSNTASAAEDFLIFLDGLDDRGIVIGQPSFGSTGQPMVIDLPGGGSARICTKRDSYPDGREFVGYGVQPDILVEKSVEALIADEDLELERALSWLKDQK